MARIIEPFEQFFDGDGDPLSGGWLKFTESGTNLTDKDTFADSAMTIANTNPLQLDSEGRCPNVFGTGTYRVTLYQNNEGVPGTQIDQKDPVGGVSGVTAFSTWDSETVYPDKAIVVGSDENYYRSIGADNAGNNPTTTPASWEQIDFEHFYNAAVEYFTGDRCFTSDGNYYVSLTDNNLGNTPSSSPSDWEDVIGDIDVRLGAIESQGILTYSATIDYVAGQSFTVGSDGLLYKCFINNGPSSSVVDPVGDATGTWLTRSIQTVEFTGSGTWTKDTGLLYIVVEGVGGGGGSGGCLATAIGEVATSEGGGGGGYCKKTIFSSDLGATETVTIGAGGTGGPNGGVGSAGGNTTFGTHFTAGGGLGGAAGVNTASEENVLGKLGGTATGGDVNITGGNSDDGAVIGAKFASYSFGGDSFFGRGSIGGSGTSPTGYGGGGGGVLNTENNAANDGVTGGGGYVVVTEYYGY